MKPPPFAYHRAADVDEALGLLRDLGEDAKVLAGGQSLMPLLNLRLAAPSALVDIGRVPGLRGLQRTDGWLEIGAATPQRDLEHASSVAAAWPLLVEAVPWIGHATIRNRGTVGGSLAHADPAAELPVVCTALDAELEVRRAGDPPRRVPARQFFTGFLTTALAPDELLTAVHLPPVPPATGQAWVEFAPRHGDFALVGVAASVRLAADSTIATARLVYGGVASTPWDAVDAAQALVGAAATDEAFRTAAEVAADGCHPPDDLHATATHRRRLVRGLTVRALREAVARARTASSDEPRRDAAHDGPRSAGALRREGGPVRRLSAPVGDRVPIRVVVNGTPHDGVVEGRRTLADFLRDDLGLTGTHLGCEHGVCGACTVTVDGATARSCLLLAAQADGADVRTVEGLAPADGPLHPIQQAFAAHHGLQCGFCTPGFLMATHELLAETRGCTDADVRARLAGNLCRCTGYQGIVDAVLAADATWDRHDLPPADGARRPPSPDRRSSSP